MSLLEANIAEARACLAGLAELGGAVDRAAALLCDTVGGGGTVLIGGNGGSAADAMHFSTELICRFERDRRPYRSICMNASGGDLTAIANDYTYADVFTRQVRAFAGPGDLVVGISTSGNSPNVVAALQTARETGAASIALLGRDGGDARGLATVDLCVDGPTTARIQEAHQLLIHTLCGLVEQRDGGVSHP